MGLPTPVEPAAGLEEQVSFLQLENEFLSNLLAARNVAIPDYAISAPASDLKPLPLAERLELCALEGNIRRGDIEQMQRDSQLELACTLAAIADCRQQEAETRRDAGALLGLLGLEAGPAASPKPVVTPDKFTEEVTAGGSSSGDLQAPADPQPAKTLALPTAKQLAKADLAGPRLEEFLAGMLARHETAAERLQARNALIQVTSAAHGRKLVDPVNASIKHYLSECDHECSCKPWALS
jgi:hypothetical protein